MWGKWVIALVGFSLLSIAFSAHIHSWGFFAHKHINRLAVFTLPPEMIGFYKKHIEFITKHAVDPDKRRYAVEGEAPHHYIDIDHYSTDDPFKIMPRKWKDAVAKYTEDTLNAYGTVPWWIQRVHWQLRDAFKSGNQNAILRYSADLGHYMGDAHVPLHTTLNYNGQLTGQRGIHGFWESRLPELFHEGYDFMAGRAEYIDYPLDAAWEAVEASHSALDSVLGFEAKLNERFPADRKYSYEKRGARTMKTYSREYAEAYHKMLNGMVERRMKAAIITIGSLWYTAWVDAGQPDLSELDNKELSEEQEEQMKQEETQWGQGKIKGRKHGE